MLAVGEALVDIVIAADGVVSEHPGGSVANVAVALARLGVPVQLATWLGDDIAGQEVMAWIAEAGVALMPGSDAARRTPTATAHLDRSGSATYEFELEWDVPSGLAAAAPVTAVHTGSLATVIEPGAAGVLAFVSEVRHTATISFDPNIRPAVVADPQATGRRVAEFVALADVVKVSADDLAWLHPRDDPHDVARRWLAVGPAMVMVTMGAAGVFAVCRSGEAVYAPPDAVPVVDTVGAGDAFMGALLWGLHTAGLLGAAVRPALRAITVDELARIVATAARAGELSVGRAGADPPTLAELRVVADSAIHGTASSGTVEP